MRPQSSSSALFRALSLATALCVLALPGAAAEVPTVLGQEGEVFRLHQGLYADLFAEGVEADPDSPVLALDILHSDGSSERLLVPGSHTDDLESSASMIFEDTTGVVYLVWQTLFNGQHPLLQLTSFNGVEFSELIQITSNVFANKGAPQLVVRREEDPVVEEGLEATRNRTTVHLTWWEEAAGVSGKRHALIVLEDGRYLGWSPIIDLGNYVLEPDTSAPPDVSGLETALSLQTGNNHRAVVAGFVNPATHRLVTVEIEAVSQIISSVADGLRGQIVIIGLNAETHSELAEMARAELLAQGTAFHEAARNYLADEVAEIVEASEQELSPEGIVAISDQLRGQIVIIGSRFDAGGLADGAESEIVEVGQSASAGGAPYHYYKITVVSDRVAPEVGGPAQLMLSESGEDVIVSWEEEGYVYYRESDGDGWSDPSSIELTENLDLETVYRMLAERVHAD